MIMGCVLRTTMSFLCSLELLNYYLILASKKRQLRGIEDKLIPFYQIQRERRSSTACPTCFVHDILNILYHREQKTERLIIKTFTSIHSNGPEVQQSYQEAFYSLTQENAGMTFSSLQVETNIPIDSSQPRGLVVKQGENW